MRIPLKITVELSARIVDDFFYSVTLTMPNCKADAAVAKVKVPADGQPQIETLDAGLLDNLGEELARKVVLLMARFVLNEMAEESATAAERLFADTTAILISHFAPTEYEALVSVLGPFVPSTPVTSTSMMRID